MDWSKFNKAVDRITGDKREVENLLSLALWSIRRLPDTHKEYALDEITKIVEGEYEETKKDSL